MMVKITLNRRNALKMSLSLSLFWVLIVFLGYTDVINARVEMGITVTDMFLEPGKQFIINTALFFSLFAFQFSVFIPVLHSKPRDYNTR